MGFLKEFWKDNKTNAIISFVIINLGSLIIYSKQHQNFNFNISEFFSFLPVVWFLFFIITMCIYGFIRGCEN
jgi:hypothetical protein